MWKGFLAGLVVANGFEWLAHKYILHGVQRKGKTRFSPIPKNMQSHWEHHKIVRQQQFYDVGYVEGIKNWRTENEILSIVIVAGVFATAFYPISKGMTLAVIYSAGNYYYTHRRAHLDAKWAKSKIPWHYDHHMNSNQDANWCVTKPWFDYLLGTRVISSKDLQEQNPLGVHLPAMLENIVNRGAELYFPVKTLQREQISSPKV